MKILHLLTFTVPLKCTYSAEVKEVTNTDIFNSFRLQPPASVIKGYVGEVQWISPLPGEKFVRHFWYIEPLLENSPSIVLLRFDESLSFNPSTQPIRLPSFVNYTYDAWASHMLGFDAPPGFFAAQLQSVNANIRNNSVCDFVSNFANYEMCAIEVGPGYEDGEIISYNAFTGNADFIGNFMVD